MACLRVIGFPGFGNPAFPSLRQHAGSARTRGMRPRTRCLGTVAMSLPPKGTRSPRSRLKPIQATHLLSIYPAPSAVLGSLGEFKERPLFP